MSSSQDASGAAAGAPPLFSIIPPAKLLSDVTASSSLW